MKEIWKDIKGWEGLYRISSLGKIISLPKRGSPRNSFVKIRIRPGNKHYASVRLCKKGNIKCYNMHRLMAEHFIENPLNLPCINHIDADKNNFSLENLEWCDYTHNNKEALKMGLRRNNDNITLNSVYKIEDIKNICKLLQSHSIGCVSKKTGLKIDIIKRVRYRISHKHISKEYLFYGEQQRERIKCCSDYDLSRKKK